MQIKIVDATTPVKELYSPHFIIAVHNRINHDDAIESTNEYSALTTATANATLATNAANAAATAAGYVNIEAEETSTGAAIISTRTPW